MCDCSAVSVVDLPEAQSISGSVSVSTVLAPNHPHWEQLHCNAVGSLMAAPVSSDAAPTQLRLARAMPLSLSAGDGALL